MVGPGPFGASMPPVRLGARKESATARLRSARRAGLAGALLLGLSAAAFASTPDLVSAILFAAALFLVPFAVGLWAEAQTLALAAAGSSFSPLPLRALLLHSRGPFEPPTLDVLPLLQREARLVARGWVVMAATLAHGFRVALAWAQRGQVVDALHAEVEPAAVEERLRSEGLAVAREGRRLVVQPVAPASPGGPAVPVRDEAVHLQWTRLRLLRLPEGGSLVRITGPPKGVRRLRKTLEGELLFEARFAWSGPARRLEARLNGLARDAQRASSIEEVSTLLADVKGVQAGLARRDFLHDDALVLSEKAHRLRALLEGRLLTGPLGAKGPDRAVAPGPALLPDVGRLVDAGDALLAAPSSFLYVPYLVVPFTSRLGGGEVLVGGATLHVDAEEGSQLLAAVSRGCTRILESGRHASFLPAPPVTPHVMDLVEADLRQRVGLTGPLVLDAGTVEVLYVPHVRVEGSLVSAVTGRRVEGTAPALAGE
ncbi:MAG TPA: hypothetical protein VNZ52_05395 [Candidatus Thermoplasmatota archaeon]|nr:hypothetical protein [Candidatus Thermoplasmatota archaeon]